jgi:hypothetical protein
MSRVFQADRRYKFGRYPQRHLKYFDIPTTDWAIFAKDLGAWHPLVTTVPNQQALL